MVNSITIFNGCLHVKGFSKFTLLNSSRSLKSNTVNIALFSMFKLFYLVNSNVLYTVINLVQSVALFLLTFFFIVVSPSVWVNSKLTKFFTFFNFFFFKFGVFTEIFFTGLVQLLQPWYSSLPFLKLFSKTIKNERNSLIQNASYCYLGFFSKLKNLYTFSLLNINLSYIYLHLSYIKIYPLAKLF